MGSKIEYSLTAAVDAYTLDELERFCAEARDKGIPGSAIPTVRLKGVTRIRTLTATYVKPAEAPS